MPSSPSPHQPFSCRVELPLGRVEVTVDRRELTLGDRGGFEARWAEGSEGDEGDREALTAEAFRLRLREHLRAVAQHDEGREPPKVTLNLASHQLLEDVIGWSRLNAG